MPWPTAGGHCPQRLARSQQRGMGAPQSMSLRKQLNKNKGVDVGRLTPGKLSGKVSGRSSCRLEAHSPVEEVPRTRVLRQAHQKLRCPGVCAHKSTLQNPRSHTHKRAATTARQHNNIRGREAPDVAEPLLTHCPPPPHGSRHSETHHFTELCSRRACRTLIASRSSCRMEGVGRAAVACNPHISNTVSQLQQERGAGSGRTPPPPWPRGESS